jgi:hypothetical protein
MKGGSNLLIVFLLLTALQVSCMPGTYCEISETTVDDQFVSIEENARFEIEEFEFIHDLWSKTGHLGCKVKNRSASDVTIVLTKTFHVSNRLAQPYFSDSELSYSTGAGATLAARSQYYNPYFSQANLAAVSSASSTTKTSRNPIEIVNPVNTYIDVGGFSIIHGTINECDLKPHPTTKETTYLDSSKESTPVLFSNIVSHESGREAHRVEHEFYISRVTNLPESKALESVYLDDSGKKLYVPKKVFSVGKASSFCYEDVKHLWFSICYSEAFKLFQNLN